MRRPAFLEVKRQVDQRIEEALDKFNAEVRGALAGIKKSLTKWMLILFIAYVAVASVITYTMLRLLSRAP